MPYFALFFFFLFSNFLVSEKELFFTPNGFDIKGRIECECKTTLPSTSLRIFTDGTDFKTYLFPSNWNCKKPFDFDLKKIHDELVQLIVTVRLVLLHCRDAKFRLVFDTILLYYTSAFSYLLMTTNS